MKKSQKTKKRIIIVMIALAVIIIGVISGVQLYKLKERNAQLEERKARLEEQLEEEQARAEELEDEAVYVQTQKYIEEKARSIGYVYPDEIIFREDD